MNGLIMEISDSSMVIMTKDGEFKQVKKPDYAVQVGMEYVVNKQKNNFSVMDLFRRRAVAVIMAIVLILPGSFGYAYYRPAGYVNIDINPSLEITFNIFSRVIEVRALNTDGEIVKGSGLDIKNDKLDVGIESIVEKAEELGYIKGDKDSLVLLTVTDSSKVDKEIQSVKDELKDKVYITVSVLNAEKAEHEEATNKGISTAEVILDKMIESEEELDDDAIKSISKFKNLEKKLNEKEKEKEKEKENDKKSKELKDSNELDELDDANSSDDNTNDESNLETKDESKNELKDKSKDESKAKSEDKKNDKPKENIKDKQLDNTKDNENSGKKDLNQRTEDSDSISDEKKTEKNNEKLDIKPQNNKNSEDSDSSNTNNNSEQSNNVNDDSSSKNSIEEKSNSENKTEDADTKKDNGTENNDSNNKSNNESVKSEKDSSEDKNSNKNVNEKVTSKDEKKSDTSDNKSDDIKSSTKDSSNKSENNKSESGKKNK